MKIFIIILVSLFVSCINQDSYDEFKNVKFPFSSKEIKLIVRKDNLNQKIQKNIISKKYEILPIGKIDFENKIGLIYCYGKIGSYGVFSDGELEQQIVALKLIKDNKVLDSILLHKKTFDEGGTTSKSFIINSKENIVVTKNEIWEDLETGKISKIDSTISYKVSKFKIDLIEKKEVLRDVSK